MKSRSRRRPDQHVRKRPTQQRARATVEAILRATAKVLRTQGYDACTTNAVARVAGVSIGSLYQYFPSKQALVGALAEQHAERGLALLTQSIAASAVSSRSLRETITHFIEAMVALHHVDPQLHRVLSQEVPRLDHGMTLVRALSERAAQLVRAWLETHRHSFRTVDLDVATFVLVTSVDAVTHTLVLEAPRQLAQAQLVSELTELVCRYLEVPPARRRRTTA